jgi:hypothetical protein
MAYEELSLRLPKKLSAAARAFLRLKGYVSRAVTHSAAELNENHEELMKSKRDEIAAFIAVRNGHKTPNIRQYLINIDLISARITMCWTKTSLILTKQAFK